MRKENWMNDVFAEMEADALADASSIATDEQLSGIAGLIQEQLNLEESVANAEEYLKSLKKDLQRLSTQTIPDAVSDANLLGDFTTADGTHVTIKPFVSASITKAKAEEAHTWLRDNNFGDIIKNTITTNAGQDHELVKQALSTLDDLGLSASVKEAVHPGTLKGFIREQVEAGTPVPLELFGAFFGQKTTVKKG